MSVAVVTGSAGLVGSEACMHSGLQGVEIALRCSTCFTTCGLSIDLVVHKAAQTSHDWVGRDPATSWNDGHRPLTRSIPGLQTPALSRQVTRRTPEEKAEIVRRIRASNARTSTWGSNAHEKRYPRTST
jgi:hypothetical protein